MSGTGGQTRVSHFESAGRVQANGTGGQTLVSHFESADRFQAAQSGTGGQTQVSHFESADRFQEAQNESQGQTKGAHFSYWIFDPTGNITALVESKMPVSQQPAAASLIMRMHPEVEQVGFVSFAESPSLETQVVLRMAGGEFCGNASMCAAALYKMRCSQCSPEKKEEIAPDKTGTAASESSGEPNSEKTADTVTLQVSGAQKPVSVKLDRTAPLHYRTSIHMPQALAIKEELFSFNGLQGLLPVVQLHGITHIIIQPESVFSALRNNDGQAAETAARSFCRLLGADGLGLMFLEGTCSPYNLTPLVYIPGGDTLFWENSCASGTAACGMYLAHKSGAPVQAVFKEPGGTLEVRSDQAAGSTELFGSVRMRGQYTL